MASLIEQRITRDYERDKRSLEHKRDQTWESRRHDVNTVTGEDEVRVKARYQIELDRIDEQLEKLKTRYYRDLEEAEGVVATSLSDLMYEIRKEKVESLLREKSSNSHVYALKYALFRKLLQDGHDETIRKVVNGIYGTSEQ